MIAINNKWYTIPTMSANDSNNDNNKVVRDRGSVYHFEWTFYSLSLVLNQP